MEPDQSEPEISADDIGICFLREEDREIVVDWGEIRSVDAVWCHFPDGSVPLEVSVEHYSGVDFQFLSVYLGYEQVMAEMEKHLIGFSRAQAEAAVTWEERSNARVIWTRDESAQPFQLRPPLINPREPTVEERAQMEAAHHASVATCERILRRPLTRDELDCVYTGFENGRIVGSIRKPLCDLLHRGQSSK